MKSLFADENFPFPAVTALRVFGYEVLTLQEAGKGEQAVSDEEVLLFSASLQRAVLTLNRKDFIKLHQTKINHSGIIVCTFDADFQALVNRIHAAINDLDFLDNQLIRITKQVWNQ